MTKPQDTHATPSTQPTPGGHTPGPWTARRMHTGGFDIFDSRNRDVVTVYGGGVGTESREANARLIASAPDLFDAAHFAKVAQAALEAYEADLGEPLDDMHELGRIDDSRGSPSFRIRVGHVRRLSAAIARATGEA